MLTPSNPVPVGAESGPNAPIGSFWYRFSPSGQGASPTLEWYVRAQHLAPYRAFRVEFSVDNHALYAVGSARTDESGVFAVHGTLSQFADQYCVGKPTVPVPIVDAHVVAVSVKADGSREGDGAEGMMGPERSLVCTGNGDGVFDYWLGAHDVVHLVNGQPIAVK